jgi:hypothetical protein
VKISIKYITEVWYGKLEIVFSIKIMILSECYEGAFLSEYYAMNRVLQSVGTNIHTMLPRHVAFSTKIVH